MNEIQKQVVYGTMLGDGHLWRCGYSSNVVLRINHCMEQLEYLKFVRNILMPYCSRIKYQNTKGNIIKGHMIMPTQVCYIYTTGCLHEFANLHRIFYVGKTKIIPESIMQILDWQGLAIWIGDDGAYLHNINRSNSDNVRVCCECFTRDDNLMAMRYMKKNFMLKCWYNEKENRIHINNRSIYRLRKYVMPLLPKSMWYKFGFIGYAEDTCTYKEQTSLSEYVNEDEKYCDVCANKEGKTHK